jgi:hypothetical protein
MRLEISAGAWMSWFSGAALKNDHDGHQRADRDTGARGAGK